MTEGNVPSDGTTTNYELGASDSGPRTSDFGLRTSDFRLPVLVACASVLQVAETLLPCPLPGIRLGLANLVTLVALVELGPAGAFRLAVLRSLASSFVLGTFLTPTFVLSFSGALASAGLMALLYRATASRFFPRLSLIGISIAGSVGHVLTQLAVVYLLFVRTDAVLFVWPLLVLSGVVMGAITGFAAIQVCRKLQAASGRAAEWSSGPVRSSSARPPEGKYLERSSFFHRIGPESKVVFVTLLALAVVLFPDYRLYAGILVLLVAAALVARAGFRPLILNLRRLLVFLVFSFLAPALFTPAGNTVFGLGPLRVTDVGLERGGIFAFRIVLLFFATSLLSLTTSPDRLAAGLENLLRPLRFLRISPGRLAQTLTLSWSFFPVLWERAQQMVRGRQKKGRAAVSNFLPDLVAGLYAEAERMADGRKESTTDERRWRQSPEENL